MNINKNGELKEYQHNTQIKNGTQTNERHQKYEEMIGLERRKDYLTIKNNLFIFQIKKWTLIDKATLTCNNRFLRLLMEFRQKLLENEDETH